MCGLLAVPLVQIHATSTYVDLPANLAAAAGILAMAAFLRDARPFGFARILVLLGCLAIAANGKPQMIAVATPAWALFALAAFGKLAAKRAVGPFRPGRPGSWLGLVCLVALAGAVIAAKPIENTINHANPLYPVRLSLLGVSLEGPVEGEHIGSDSIADEWRPVPSPLRWLASVLEFGAYAYRPLPWTYDQGYCPDMLALRDCGTSEGQKVLMGGVAFRMGGYFAAYVLALVAFLGWSLARSDARTRRVLLTVFLSTTFLASVLPRSHELRYYLFWMIVLVALCLISGFSGLSATARTLERHPRKGKAVDPNAVVRPGTDIQARILGDHRADCTAVGRVDDPRAIRQPFCIRAGGRDPSTGYPAADCRGPDGAVVCVGDAGMVPFSFFLASIFHTGRSYALRDRPLEPGCDGVLPKRPS